MATYRSTLPEIFPYIKMEVSDEELESTVQFLLKYRASFAVTCDATKGRNLYVSETAQKLLEHMREKG